MRDYQLYWITVVIFFAVMMLMPLISFDGYSYIANTTSHLGAQKVPFNMVMNTAFVALGLMTFYSAKDVAKPYPVLKVCFFAFAVSLIGVGVFQHHPPTGEEGHIILDRLHSFFATSTGFSFFMLALVSVFVLDNLKEKVLALLLALIALMVPIMMILLPHIQGLLQRLMFFVAFLWIGLLLKQLLSLKEKNKAHV